MSLLQPAKVKKSVKKRVAQAPYIAKPPVRKKEVNPLVEKRPRNYGIGELVSMISG